MKIGPIDGSAEEVRDLFENCGLNLEDYLEKPTAPLKLRFLIVPGIILAIVLLFLGIFSDKWTPTILNIIYLAGFSGGTWLTVSTQIRFKNGMATFIVAIGALLMLLIASGIFSPKDTAEFIKELH